MLFPMAFTTFISQEGIKQFFTLLVPAYTRIVVHLQLPPESFEQSEIGEYVKKSVVKGT